MSNSMNDAMCVHVCMPSCYHELHEDIINLARKLAQSEKENRMMKAKIEKDESLIIRYQKQDAWHQLRAWAKAERRR